MQTLNTDAQAPAVKCTTIGGQALMEGILMKGPSEVSIVTRSSDGELTLVKEPVDGWGRRYKIFRLPFLRGIAALVDSMGRGMRAMEYAADKAMEGEEEDEKPGFLERHLGKKKADAIAMVLMTVIAVAGAIGLFFFVPTLISGFLRPYVKSTVVLNLIEGVFRIAIFLIYVLAISRIEELKRVFMYHGAEHKTIACYEHGEELTVENVRKYPRVHPRCGTSFIANLVILSALLLSLFGWPNPWLRLLIRVLMIPILVAITYELNVWTGKHENFLARALRAPGMFVQRVATVREPDDSMIEVAIMALKAVIPEDPEADRWV